MDPLPAPVLGSFPTKDERTWGLAIHLSAFAGHIFPFAHLIVPLVIWSMKRQESSFLDDQGREAVNAQITFTIYAAVAFALCFVLIGIPLFAALYIGNFVLVIVAAIAANEGKHYRYPLILRLVK